MREALVFHGKCNKKLEYSIRQGTEIFPQTPVFQGMTNKELEVLYQTLAFQSKVDWRLEVVKFQQTIIFQGKETRDWRFLGRHLYSKERRQGTGGFLADPCIPR